MFLGGLTVFRHFKADFFRTLQCVAIGLFLAACGADSNRSQTAAFVPVRAKEATQLDFQLKRASASHQVLRREIEGGRYDFDRYDHQIVFDPMSQAEFNSLKQIYSSFSLVKNNVQFVPGASYTLADFMPPIVRALLGWHFTEEVSEILLDKRQKILANSVVNCWGAAFEVLREARLPEGVFSAFYAHDDVMQKFLRDARYSQVVKFYSKNSSDYATAQLRNAGLKPGDLLLVGDTWLYHVAIYIDDDLFFEKSGSGSRTMFRFVTYDILSRTWNPELYGWSFRRFDGEPLPDPMSLFGVRAVFGADSAMKQIPEDIAADLSAVRDQTTGRARDTFFVRKRFSIDPSGGLVGPEKNSRNR